MTAGRSSLRSLFDHPSQRPLRRGIDRRPVALAIGAHDLVFRHLGEEQFGLPPRSCGRGQEHAGDAAIEPGAAIDATTRIEFRLQGFRRVVAAQRIRLHVTQTMEIVRVQRITEPMRETRKLRRQVARIERARQHVRDQPGKRGIPCSSRSSTTALPSTSRCESRPGSSSAASPRATRSAFA